MNQRGRLGTQGNLELPGCRAGELRGQDCEAAEAHSSHIGKGLRLLRGSLDLTRMEQQERKPRRADSRREAAK